MQFLSLSPVLMSADVERSLRFYKDRLGFSLLFQDTHSDPRYAVLSRDSVKVHIQWNDPAQFSPYDRPNYRFEVDDPDALFDEYVASGAVDSTKTLTDTPWGTREFGLYDPDRNGVFFYRNLH